MNRLRIGVVPAIAIASFLGGCEGIRSHNCDSAAPLPGIDASLAALPDLQLSVSTMMRAHCACEFDEDARSRFPLGVDGKGGWDVDKSQLCLGKLKIRSWTVEGEDLVSIDFALAATTGADPRDSLVVFANLVDGRWLLSWPTGTGPEIH